MSNPPAPQTTWADILRELDEPAPDIHPGVPIAFMVGWGAISTLALGSGMLIGYRSFDGSVAHEALDHAVEKPSPAAEAMATRVAVRALGWGTAAAFGSAALAVAAAYALGVRSASDVTSTARSALGPLDSWLKSRGEWLQSCADGSRTHLDGLCDGIAERWQSTWAGQFSKRRIEGQGAGGGGAAAAAGNAKDSDC
jgi:hypothetical protein